MKTVHRTRTRVTGRRTHRCHNRVSHSSSLWKEGEVTQDNITRGWPQIHDIGRRTGDAQPGKGCGCEPPRAIADLVKVRASQIKGCAYCLDMHTKDSVAFSHRPASSQCDW
jgi:AhpD family alkylhydroperoxidase